MPNDPTPLVALLRARLDALSWAPADLHRALGERGHHYSPQAVGAWCRGASVPLDRARVVLADVLQIDLDELLRAAAGVPSDRTPGQEW